MKLKRTASIAALAMIGLSTGGCATLHNGTHETVTLDSTPQGAEALVDGTQHLTTPAQVELERGKDHQVAFHKNGYQDSTATITSGESGWVWGNILIGGLPGIIADEMDGAAKKLSTDHVAMSLPPAVGASSGASPAVGTNDSSATANTLVKPVAQTETVGSPAPSAATLVSQPVVTSPGKE